MSNKEKAEVIEKACREINKVLLNGKNFEHVSSYQFKLKTHLELVKKVCRKHKTNVKQITKILDLK